MICYFTSVHEVFSGPSTLGVSFAVPRFGVFLSVVRELGRPYDLPMKHRFGVGILLLSAILTSCSLSKSSNEYNAVASVALGNDSIVIYNDSVDDILFNAKKVLAYDMADFVQQSDFAIIGDTIFNYQVKKKIGPINNKELNILSFIIADKSWYIKEYNPVRRPFSPDFTLEFIHKKRHVYMFVSFGTEEVAIADSKGNFKFYQMRNKHILARWALLKFPDKEYYINL